MHKKQKQATVDDLKQKIEGAQAIFLADFAGINVKDITRLRKNFREASVEYLVAKNTLVTRALDGGQIEGLEGYLEGPTALVLAPDDGVGAAKIISEFSKDREAPLKIKVGVMANKVVDASVVDSLAKLPSREVLISKLLGSLNSPISGLVITLNQTLGKGVRVLEAIRQQKEEQAKV